MLYNEYVITQRRLVVDSSNLAARVNRQRRVSGLLGARFAKKQPGPYDSQNHFSFLSDPCKASTHSKLVKACAL